MKKIFTPLFLGLAMFIWAGCGEDEGQSADQATANTAESEAPADAANQRRTGTLAVSLWDKAGLRTAPGRGKEAEYITTINFGELVTYLDEEKEVESEDRTYVKVRLTDGSEGWTNQYLMAMDAMRAVAVEPIQLYRRPDLTTITDKSFEEGEIFAVLASENGDWVEVVGKQRKKEGWMRKDQAKFTTDEIDVTVAILLDRAMQESNPADREEALTQIAENPSFSTSALMPKVKEALSEVPTIPDLPANQLYITADKLNVRSEPDTEADNVVFQVSQGDILTIRRRGDLATIREMEDYWYEIENQNGEVGWIFGYFTSKRLED